MQALLRILAQMDPVFLGRRTNVIPHVTLVLRGFRGMQYAPWQRIGERYKRLIIDIRGGPKPLMAWPESWLNRKEKDCHREVWYTDGGNGDFCVVNGNNPVKMEDAGTKGPHPPCLRSVFG